MSMTKEQLRAMFANMGKGKTKTKKTSLKRPTTGKKSKVQRWQPTGYTGVGLVKTKSLKEMKRTPIKKNKITHLQLQKQMDKYEKEHSTRKKDIKAHLKEYEKEHSTRKKDIQQYLKGQKDGRKIGKKTGGRGRNETSNCRHPDKNPKSKKWRKVKGTIAIDAWLKDKNIVLVEHSKSAPGWVALYGKEGKGTNWISNEAVSREQARKQAINFMQGKYKTSPMGRLYIGKATFQNAKWAQERANHLKAHGSDAWIEGKTVYNH